MPLRWSTSTWFERRRSSGSSVERERELVDRLLEHRRALDDAGRPERVLRAQVRLQRERHAAHVGAAVERQRGHEHREEPAPLPHRDHGVGVDRDERAVAAGAEPDGLARPGAAAAVELLGVPVVDETHRSAGDPRQLGGEDCLGAGALLAAEAAADVLGDHAHLVLADPEQPCELVARGEHALRRDPGGEPVAVPVERRPRAARAASADARGSRSGARRGRRPRRGAVSTSPRASSDGSRVKRCSRSASSGSTTCGSGSTPSVERRDPRGCGFDTVGGDDGDRLAGVLRLGDEQRRPRRERDLALGAERRTHPGGGARRVEIEAVTRPCPTGERRTAAWSIPGSATSTV